MTDTDQPKLPLRSGLRQLPKPGEHGGMDWNNSWLDNRFSTSRSG